MADDAPNGRELRDMMIRLEGKLSALGEKIAGVERQRDGLVKWLAGIAALVIGSIIVGWLRH